MYLHLLHWLMMAVVATALLGCAAEPLRVRAGL